MYHYVKKLMSPSAWTNLIHDSATCCWSSSVVPTARRGDAVFHPRAHCDDAARKDLLMDISTEELSHLEIVGTLARMHLKSVREEAEPYPLIAIAGGGGVNLHNSMRYAWTADYLKITGELDVDLRSNIAAEAAV